MIIQSLTYHGVGAPSKALGKQIKDFLWSQGHLENTYFNLLEKIPSPNDAAWDWWHIFACRRIVPTPLVLLLYLHAFLHQVYYYAKPIVLSGKVVSSSCSVSL